MQKDFSHRRNLFSNRAIWEIFLEKRGRKGVNSG
jgi:hypothetical protein